MSSITVKCSQGHTREIKPGEIGADDFPMCQQCYGPMFPVKATAKVKR